jgi:hypothetical protein
VNDLIPQMEVLTNHLRAVVRMDAQVVPRNGVVVKVIAGFGLVNRLAIESSNHPSGDVLHERRFLIAVLAHLPEMN